jgi:hypothetical protein
MGVFKMILYPFGFAFASLGVVTLLAMVVLGTQPKDWEPWQNDLVSSVGTAAGLVGMLVGSWLAVRAEQRAAH